MTEEWTKAIRHRNTEALQDFYEKTYWWSLWTKQMSAYDMHLFNTQSSKRTFLEKIIGSWQSARVLVCVPPLSKFSKTKQTNDIISKENDTVISDKKQIAELFNTHFIQQIADRAPEISEVDHDKIMQITQAFSPFASATQEVFAVFNTQIRWSLKNINCSWMSEKSCGHNMFPGAPNVNFWKISVRITIWDRIFGTFVVKFLLACLS